MLKVVSTIVLFVLGYLPAGAQSFDYSMTNVADSLKNKADIITHLEEYDFKVDDIDEATLNVHQIFTVLNEDGKYALTFKEYVSKYVSLEDPEIRVFDAGGKQTGKYKKKDMTTVGVGEGLIEDGYVTFYNISSSVYPVTVELKYQLKYKSTLNVPDFMFISPRVGVIQSSYTAHVPPDMGLRYKTKNTNIQPNISDEGGYKVYKWAVQNLKPFEDEAGAVAGVDRFPHVSMTLNKFSYHGRTGDLSSWQSFGTWLNDLYTGLDELPAERQQFFASLVKDAPSEREKIKLIYHYMQQNFRYVSIQLGVGGIKPFPATFTDQKKYGDCKALSNYMKAALKTVGIKSYVAIINATYNTEPVDPGFPANGFNHVILCVPMPGDSVWLECTSSTAAFGELGSFTENKNALLVTETGGVLIPTPSSHASANKFSSVTHVGIEQDLSGDVETTFTTTGEYTDVMNSILKDKKDDQKRAIVYYFGSKQPDDFILTKTDSTNKQGARLKMVLVKVPEFTSGEKWFINPRIYKIWSAKLPKADNRKMDFYFPFPFEKSDTTIFKLPPGSKPDALTSQKDLSCSYAFYQRKTWYNEAEHSIYSATNFTLKKHKVLAADYPLVKKFFDDLLQEDTQRFILNVAEIKKKAF